MRSRLEDRTETVRISRRIALVWLVAACSSARAEQAPPDGAAVLKTYCAGCHAAKAEGDLGFITDTARLVAEGFLVPGDAARSPVFARVADGEMPPDGVKRRPSAAEVAALRAWIDGLAPPRAAFRDERTLASIVAAADRRLAARDRAAMRWVSLAHLANAGVPEPQLEHYRVALGKLLASLTWSPGVPVPIAVDAERTIFRIDLRELGWSSATWDRIRAAYPYGLARPAGEPEVLRADWLVATASRPPLYEAILELPGSQDELARRLGVDLGDDLERGRVARAGFNRSGVSVNNRVIERHVTAYGAFWRSYDFGSSSGRENVFAHPLDFVPAGGELIWNLPNGMQAYMLVDAAGQRIAKAPTAIVSDPRRPDRAVENGVSCFGCHAAGILPKPDELRAAASSLPRDVAVEVRRLHPPQRELDTLYAADRARFARALGALGAAPTEPASEPIGLLVARYEGELDLAHAAAELGWREGELRGRLARATSTRAVLGSLATGGTIKRDTWAPLFPRIAEELGAGIALAAGPSPATPAVWIDRGRHTWVLAATAIEQQQARQRCAERGLVLPTADELAVAVDAGLIAALQPRRALWSGTTKLDASNLRYALVVDGTGLARRADVTDRLDAVCVQR